MKVSLARALKRLYYVASAIIILVALLIATARLFTPYFNKHLPDVDVFASRLLNAPVKIGNVYISWHLYQPELSFDQVDFLDDKTHKPKFHIETASVSFNIFDSLLKRQMQVDRIRVSGVHLIVHQSPSGAVGVASFSGMQMTDSLTGSTVQSNDIFAWVFSIPHLILKKVNIDFYPASSQKLSFTLNRFVLNNSGNTHDISGQGILNQDIPTQLSVQTSWQGNPTDLPHVSAKIYVYVEGINLPQWSKNNSWHNLQILQGLGSTKIWATWANNDWQTIQSRLQFYDIQIKSLTTKKTQIISRLTGDIGWRRDGNKQVFAGAQIFLDLPEHLWPVTGFSVVMTPDPSGNLFPETVHVAYLDINDAKNFALASGILPDDIQKNIQVLDPTGKINDFQLHFPYASMNPTTATVDAAFDGLSIDAGLGLPGMSHLSGVLSWNGQSGTLNLNSTQTVLRMNKVFDNNLWIGKLTGIINLHHDANDNWSLDTKNLFAMNADVKTYVNMTLNIPQNDSPQINLSGDFKVMNAAHISNYLPLKIFEPDLVKWLRAAFISGQLESGKAIVQGKLSDFPFDHGTGSFVISGEAKNTEFNYAPDWPVISNLNGKLVFSGRTMTIDVVSGQIFNVPISAIHAVIPYIGDTAPQILTIEGGISADLSDMLHFIHASPLEKAIGSDFGAMMLRGPMQLKLGLSIPLKNPEDAKVQGDLTFPEATMEMPVWKLSVEKLQGALHFTESDIMAKGLQGKLFGENLTLDIATQHTANQPSHVQASFQNLLDVEMLQKWLDMPLTSVATGKTAIAGVINIYSHKQATQSSSINLHTDLKGVSLNLPEQYGKNANDTRDFEVDITTPKDELRAKISYAKLLTAALTFKQTNLNLNFSSGELNLGGDAKWQTQPGLLVSGEFKTIDWDAIQSKFSSSESKLTNVSLLRAIDLNIGQFNIYGQQLHHAHIQLSNANHAWLVNINSQEMVGQVTMPSGNPQQTIQAKFQRFYLKSGSNTAAVNPKNLPAISFSGSDVRYNNQSIGSVVLNLVPSQTGLSIRDLTASSSLGQLHAQGDWLGANGKLTTHLQGDINTTRVSDLLNAWGYGSNNFVGNKGDVHFDLTWPGTPYDPSIAGMNGSVSLSLGPGRIVNLSDSNNAKMDFARLLNILSLTSLPHLGELFQKGYSFDYVKGDYSLKNGNALTENTNINGQIARIKITGRIGFANKDFDLMMRVTPYVTESLPFVAAAVSAWNPITGIAAWMINKMVVSKAVSSAATNTYSVKGPWNNPVWNQVGGSTQSGKKM